MSDRSSLASRNLGAVDTLLGGANSLENINTTLLDDGCFCYVTAEHLHYELHKDDTASPSPPGIVAPIAGPGRWVPATGGIQGAQGGQGSQGGTGAQGSQGGGFQGAQGFQGRQGAQGSQGAQGQQGSGSQGAQGGTGAQGPGGGAQGGQGFQGSAGAQGGVGVQGAQGSGGTAGAQGSQGFQGAQGRQGAAGTNGTTGTQGAQGFQGATGSGAQGSQGAGGAAGAQGSQGFQGAQGRQGATGTTGTQGAQGFQGGAATGSQAVSFTPSSPADWPNTPPTTVQTALDGIAQPAAEQHASGSLGPTPTVTFTTGAITTKKNGTYLVIGMISGTSTGAADQACDLLADGVSIAQSVTGTGGSASTWNATLSAVVALSDTTTHTFSVRATASTGNNSVGAGQARIVLVEFGG